MTIRGLLASVFLTGAFLLWMNAVSAQHNHAAGHDEYQNWSSRKVANCCNSQDCSGVDDSDIQETATGPQVRIDGQWCPVLSQHYLTRGKSPDWSVAHACIRTGNDGCERLLCFTPRGLF